jgi:hypothetical protein
MRVSADAAPRRGRLEGYRTGVVHRSGIVHAVFASRCGSLRAVGSFIDFLAAEYESIRNSGALRNHSGRCGTPTLPVSPAAY